MISKWIRRLLSLEPLPSAPEEKKRLMQVNLETGTATPVEETEGGKLWAKIATNRCPDCGVEGFFEGPHGGMSINIVCSGPEKHWFNVTPGIGIAERIKR